MGISIFITGISGYLGQVLAEQLAMMPEIDRITGIDVSKPRFGLPSKVRYVQKDIRAADLANMIAGYDVVIHTAFIVLWPSKLSETDRDDININGTRNVAKAALARGVNKFLQLSSQAAYDPQIIHGQMNVTEDFPLGEGNSGFYYWDNKAVLERDLNQIFQSSSVKLTIFRPSYVIGQRNTTTVDGWRKNAANILGHVMNAQFIHEDDMAEAFALAIRSDMPGAFNVVPDDVIGMRRFFELIGKKHVPIVPFSVARLVMLLRWRYLGSLEHPSWLDSALLDFKISNAQLKSFGWNPRYNCEGAIRTAL
jgi:nucleoside-diphosphate-sugar epimerase